MVVYLIKKEFLQHYSICSWRSYFFWHWLSNNGCSLYKSVYSTSGPSSSKPAKANPTLVENFNCYFFTAKEGFEQNCDPKRLQIITYFSCNLNLVKNPSLNEAKYNLGKVKTKPMQQCCLGYLGGSREVCRGIAMCFGLSCLFACLLLYPPSLPYFGVSIYTPHTGFSQWCVDGCLGGGLWLGCHGDLLAAEESAVSSIATFTAPTLQNIGVVF